MSVVTNQIAGGTAFYYKTVDVSGWPPIPAITHTHIFTQSPAPHSEGKVEINILGDIVCTSSELFRRTGKMNVYFSSTAFA